MDFFEWNKIAGAVLGTVLFILVVQIAAEAIFHVEPPDRPVYIVEGVEEAALRRAPVAEEPPPEPLPDFAALIPIADAMAGEAAAERCALCHTWNEGGQILIGPNLFGIIGRARASDPDFGYSLAITERGGEWTYEDLFQFLKSPALFLPGNQMAFAGLPRNQDVLDLLAFMRSWASAPPPLLAGGGTAP